MKNIDTKKTEIKSCLINPLFLCIVLLGLVSCGGGSSSPDPEPNITENAVWGTSNWGEVNWQ